MAALSGDGRGRSVAIVPWGDGIEEFLEPLGLDLAAFVSRMSGGWLFGYAAALKTAGWRPVILCASEAVGQPTSFSHGPTGVRIWAVPGRRTSPCLAGRSASLRSLVQWLRTPAGQFRALLAREGCAALIIQEYEHPRFDILVRVARRMGVAAFGAFQGGERTLSRLEAMVRPGSLRAARGLIVPSPQERARLAHAYPELDLRIAPIPNPLDLTDWWPGSRDQARAELGLPPDAFVLLNHGRIDISRKGLDILLAAWTQFSAERPQARLTMIGSGQDREAFAALLAAGPQAGLTWIADYVVNPAFIRRWMAAADAYVTTSRLEGMPVAPLEAMACGLPVISSNAQGLADIFEGGQASGGLVTPVGEVAAVVGAMRRVADDLPLRMRLGQAARRRVEAAFSVEAVGAALGGFIDGR